MTNFVHTSCTLAHWYMRKRGKATTFLWDIATYSFVSVTPSFALTMVG